MTVYHVYLWGTKTIIYNIITGTLNHMRIAGSDARYKMRTFILRVTQPLKLFQ